MQAVLAADGRGHVVKRHDVLHDALVGGVEEARQELFVGRRGLGPGQLVEGERPRAPADLVLRGESRNVAIRCGA